MVAVEDDDVGFLADLERAGLAVQPQVLGAVDGGEAQHVACIGAAAASPPGTAAGLVTKSLTRTAWLMTIRCCMVMAERIWVKKSAVMLVSTSVLSDGSSGSCDCILTMGGMPWRMFISIGNASKPAPTSLTFPGGVRHAGHVDEQVVGSEPDALLTPPVPAAR